ncbi:hypothetical protein KSP40_PGU011082 [Platanthera guangdongensis]|uniref:Uncharacterized protein n=1 Tax=Platanthera guangdongensis TaxID=2320717 RepID=A0ABR2MHK1_9ASPA
MERLAATDWSEDIEKKKVDMLVKYVLSKFLLPLQVLKISSCIHNFGGFEEFHRYNWPTTMHKFMSTQLRLLSQKASTRSAEESIGYLVERFVLHSRMFFHVRNNFSELKTKILLILRVFPKKVAKEGYEDKEKEVDEEEESNEKHIMRFVTDRLEKINDGRRKQRKKEIKEEKR